MKSLVNRLREWLGARAEQRAVVEEMRFHIDCETARNVERGMSPAEARRRARRDFGGVDRFSEQARDERSGTRLADFRATWLDWKLGGRMLVKYPGLSIIGGIALAAAMGLGAGWFELSWELRSTALPLPGGDRIVRLENRDAVAAAIEPRAAHDFLAWREQLTTIELLGAYRDIERNLITADGRALPVDVAEISPSAFALTRVPPLLGRPLVAADTVPGAEDVVVIGYDIWRGRFNADSAIIGRTVRLGQTRATVVGVMPEKYRFPIHHQLWTPLRVPRTQPRRGPAIAMFGRLREGVSLRNAQAELTTIGERMAAAHPATHAHLRPRVLAYAAPSGDVTEVLIANIIAWVILAATGVNVATLMFARTALRESEIIVRNALGASRARVMGQLFAESLVLGLASAAVSLVGVTLFFRWAIATLASNVDYPFWWDLTLSPATVLYTAALAVAGAAIVGLLPAIRATGPRVQAALRTVGGGGTHMQIGGMWSALIVAQVALSVIGLPVAIAATSEALTEHRIRSAFDAGPYLTFRPQVDAEMAGGAGGELEGPEHVERLAAVLAEVERSLLQEPEVVAVTYADALPGVYHPLVHVEMQRDTEPPVRVNTNIESDRVRVSAVDVDFFDVFRTPLVVGRSFRSFDVGAANGVVVINESLAKNIGGNPIGVRLRTGTPGAGEPPGRWLEVIGVVRNLGLDPTTRGEEDFLFTPASITTLPAPPSMVVRVDGSASAFAPRLRAIGARVAPELRLYDVLPLEEVIRRDGIEGVLMTLIGVGVVLLVLLLSAAGLYGLMSVAVARRTREIGIRLAIGGSPRAVLMAVFRSAALQVAGGVAIGNVLVLLLLSVIVDELQVSVAAVPMLTASLIMTSVGLVACLVPARRALGVQPTVALKSAQ